MRDKILDIFKLGLKKDFKNKVKKILLFGSRARGDAAVDSDYDLLLVMDEVSPIVKKQINRLEGEMLFNYNAVFSAFPFTLKELERRQYEPFLMNAQKEGREI
ncbi:hypothetical protein A2625_06540 [candidate division WOR-1 bacterium RIFCSPHIGHO2_01_FULL_53_15]|uniref:Polymerase nucleotidyl transferase domain-containing protein n=1 Tax=candidate division WOR-1 bacterium RIFCSPHIGHO2_01_FULL_53_15 TaxID=1802564 RepID=A0A1F4Q1E7_UNCSA|nr:MAG: hypothetical protein A2625_06540 [candidate division WOR-1 bacterium RIFCSPHIGHO2_01_FULL_53_15]OGC12805.1 MAG: hypothetical protein A3D23_03620 [candidate division WOR-1 bacterium RIFCSPHIGHO2_02_FULL_53_26]